MAKKFRELIAASVLNCGYSRPWSPNIRSLFVAVPARSPSSPYRVSASVPPNTTSLPSSPNTRSRPPLVGCSVVTRSRVVRSVSAVAVPYLAARAGLLSRDCRSR